MGKATETIRLSDAARGRSFGGVAVRSVVTAFRRDQSGATAIEYGLIISCIFLAIVTGVSLFAGNTTTMYGKITNAVGSTR